MKLLNFFRIELSIFSLLAALTGGCGKSAPSTAAIAAVNDFDLERYLGVWYEVARLPFYFENGMSNVTARYYRDDDGVIRVENCGIKNQKIVSASGVVKFKNFPHVGELEVSFFRPFYGDYRIIMLDENYTFAVVTGEKMDKLWLLARKPFPEGKTVAAIIEKLQKLGFDVSQLIFSQTGARREL